MVFLKVVLSFETVEKILQYDHWIFCRRVRIKATGYKHTRLSFANSRYPLTYQNEE